MKVGSIVQVRSFSEYTVKVPLEENDDYVPVSRIPAGTFVSIRSAQGSVIGIVTGVKHDIKEEFLPFLSEEKQETFVPYVNDYRSSYIVVKGIGNVRDNKATQSLDFTPVVNDIVEVMDKDAIRAFHMPGGKPGFSYYKNIHSKVEPDTLCLAIDRIAESLPESRPMLAALKKYTERKA